jgi:hypothetical protein
MSFYNSSNLLLKVSAAFGFAYFFKEAYKYKKTSNALHEIKTAINLDLSFEKIDPQILNRDILMATSIIKLSNKENHKQIYNLKTYLNDKFNEIQIINVK